MEGRRNQDSVHMARTKSKRCLTHVKVANLKKLFHWRLEEEFNLQLKATDVGRWKQRIENTFYKEH